MLCRSAPSRFCLAPGLICTNAGLNWAQRPATTSWAVKPGSPPSPQHISAQFWPCHLLVSSMCCGKGALLLRTREGSGESLLPSPPPLHITTALLGPHAIPVLLSVGTAPPANSALARVRSQRPSATGTQVQSEASPPALHSEARPVQGQRSPPAAEPISTVGTASRCVVSAMDVGWCACRQLRVPGSRKVAFKSVRARVGELNGRLVGPVPDINMRGWTILMSGSFILLGETPSPDLGILSSEIPS